MLKKILITLFVILIGISGGYFFFQYFSLSKNQALSPISFVENKINSANHGEVVGFLPYWLLAKADQDYPRYLNTLTYFSLSLQEDGTIQKYTNPGEAEPGYYALKGGKANRFLSEAKAKGQKLSLSVFCANDQTITTLLDNPQSAGNLVSDIAPIIEEYGFGDINLDIEQVGDASPAARIKFINFVKGVKNSLNNQTKVRLSIDISASAFVKDTNLADPVALAPFVDRVIIMAYDYHYTGSSVTGPVAPGQGAGVFSEFDTQAAVEAALEIMPSEKIILGIPLYGYEWESIGNTPRSAIIPTTGLVISNRRAESFLSDCASCSAVFDQTDKENYIIYKDQQTNTYHQIFYPDKKSTEYKVELAKEKSLGGIALWALGYEGETILEPLSSYRNQK